MNRLAERVTLERLQSDEQHPGGERFRLWTSIKGKRVEEGDDALANQLSANQPVKRDAFALAA
jgi:hypothetical protein